MDKIREKIQPIDAVQGELLVYQTEDGTVKLEVKLENETIWLTQQMMAELFRSTKQNISLHLKNIFKEGELDADSVVKESLTTAADGKRYKTVFYNLDAVISVGYRVKSLIATRFRIWATQRLKEYIIKGFVMDDERLKNPPVAGSAIPDYFDEMLERIRDIRASERRMYLRVREIFAMAADYQPSHKETNKFFSVIQNKLHYAATGKTAAELIHSRVDSKKPNMGLTNWILGSGKFFLVSKWFNRVAFLVCTAAVHLIPKRQSINLFGKAKSMKVGRNTHFLKKCCGEVDFLSQK